MPMILPFVNVNYKVSRTFKLGLTGGTTYSFTDQIINYQLLFGAKMTL
jgi:hypothetical protein